MADNTPVAPPPVMPAVTTATSAPPADPDKKPSWFAYFQTGEDTPVAIFRDDVASLGVAFRTELANPDQVDVIALGDKLNVDVPQGVKDHLADLHRQRTAVAPNPQANDVLKAEIRNQMTQDRLRAQVTKEIEKEFAEQDRKAKAEGKPAPASLPAAPAPPTPTSPSAVGVKP